MKIISLKPRSIF